MASFLVQNNLDKPAPERLTPNCSMFQLKQEMMGWQWYQLDHTQIICTLLHADNRASTSSLKLTPQAACSS